VNPNSSIDLTSSGTRRATNSDAFLVIDLCDENEDAEGAQFARQLQLAFDGIELIGDPNGAGDANASFGVEAKNDSRAIGASSSNASTSSAIIFDAEDGLDGVGGMATAATTSTTTATATATATLPGSSSSANEDCSGASSSLGRSGDAGSTQRIGRRNNMHGGTQGDAQGVTHGSSDRAVRASAEGKATAVAVIDLDSENEVEYVPSAEERARAERQAAKRRRNQLAIAKLQEQLQREVEMTERAKANDILWSQRNQIRNWLSKHAQRLKVRDVYSNPAAAPGGALYESFAAAHARAEEKTIRLVFHGTREENITSICANGLDPKRRGRNGQALGAGEYFAEDPHISLPYCVGGKKMIVFAVLMDRSGLTNRQQGIVVVHKSEHQLPMFVISFDLGNSSSSGPSLGSTMAAALAARTAAVTSSWFGQGYGRQVAQGYSMGYPRPVPTHFAKPAKGHGRKRARRDY